MKSALIWFLILYREDNINCKNMSCIKCSIDVKKSRLSEQSAYHNCDIRHVFVMQYIEIRFLKLCIIYICQCYHRLKHSNLKKLVLMNLYLFFLEKKEQSVSLLSFFRRAFHESWLWHQLDHVQIYFFSWVTLIKLDLFFLQDVILNNHQ